MILERSVICSLHGNHIKTSSVERRQRGVGGFIKITTLSLIGDFRKLFLSNLQQTKF